jgi:hypothetical protein
MKIKTSELTGAALDWAVAKCEGGVGENQLLGAWYAPSTDWAQGGEIIEREKMAVMTSVDDANEWVASIFEPNWNFNLTGPTPLIAAMRCYVASKIGNEVEIPEELT